MRGNDIEREDIEIKDRKVNRARRKHEGNISFSEAKMVVKREGQFFVRRTKSVTCHPARVNRMTLGHHASEISMSQNHSINSTSSP
uniref:Uncharacterized protein n=1 Tax=Manihot esculenta TaxID=3983 RepID=A0A199U980_MANES